MNINMLNETYAVVKLPPAAELPGWVLAGTVEFISVTRTAEELSIVCPEGRVPAEAKAETVETGAEQPMVADRTEGQESGDANRSVVQVEGGWAAMKVEGVLDFGLTGILASIANPLAERSIPIFAISTYNTDYILVKRDTLAAATDALTAAGHQIGN